MKQEFKYGEPVEVRNEGGVWVVRKYIGIKYFTRVNTWDDEYQEWDEIRKLPEHTATEGLIDIKQPEQGTIEYLQGQIHSLTKRLYIIESKLENQIK